MAVIYAEIFFGAKIDWRKLKLSDNKVEVQEWFNSPTGPTSSLESNHPKSEPPQGIVQVQRA